MLQYKTNIFMFLTYICFHYFIDQYEYRNASDGVAAMQGAGETWGPMFCSIM